MKMSKQERIALLIFLVLLTLGIGTFMFIVPVFNTISANQLVLNNKKTELEGYKQTQLTKDPLKQEVIDAYEAGESKANMFFDEMNTYQADNEVRAFIKYCQDDLNIDISVEEFKISKPSTLSLSVEFSDDESEITYDLKTFATQGVELTQEEQDKIAKETAKREKLAGAQTVGAIEVSLSVNAEKMDELIKFMDAVNEYMKDDGESGINRKALILGGFEGEWAELEDDSVEGDAEAPSADSEEIELYKLSTTLTFLSIERMQDPTDQLEAQEAQ